MKLSNTPVNTETPHTFTCSGCGHKRTLRNKFWQIVIWCDTCKAKAIHNRQD